MILSNDCFSTRRKEILLTICWAIHWEDREAENHGSLISLISTLNSLAGKEILFIFKVFSNFFFNSSTPPPPRPIIRPGRALVIIIFIFLGNRSISIFSIDMLANFFFKNSLLYN